MQFYWKNQYRSKIFLEKLAICVIVRSFLLPADERIKIIEQSGFLTCIKGKNSFAGYYAFVYSTGTVILEKFWSDEERLLPAKEDATFVMNIDNFMEMSKLSKLKLIEYIKSFPNTGVKRRYHTSSKYL